MALELPETASPTTRAIAEVLRERGELTLGSDASYAERKALLESSSALTPAFATTRAEQLRKRARTDLRVLALATISLLLSGINFLGETVAPIWLGLVVLLVVAAATVHTTRWKRKHEAALLHDLLAVALSDDAETEPTDALSAAPAPLTPLDDDAAHEPAPFTRARARTRSA